MTQRARLGRTTDPLMWLASSLSGSLSVYFLTARSFIAASAGPRLLMGQLTSSLFCTVLYGTHTITISSQPAHTHTHTDLISLICKLLSSLKGRDLISG